MVSYPDTCLKSLNEKIAPGLLQFVTPIRTEMDDCKTEHSGTGLLLSTTQKQVYCLTASHVLLPENRVPPSSMRAKCHFHTHCQNKESDSKQYMFRRKFYKNDNIDIALAESSLSGTVLQEYLKLQYAPLEQFVFAKDIKTFDDDTFLMAGFPTSHVTEQPATRHANYGFHTFYFRGKDMFSKSISDPFYEFNTKAHEAPHGMSGAPIWMIRLTEQVNRPMTPDNLCLTKIKEDTILFTFFYYGTVTRFNPTSKRFVVIKPSICRQFVAEHHSNMEDIRLPSEHDNINDYAQFVVDGGYTTANETK